jgi:energy-coupling factor transport system permease protein
MKILSILITWALENAVETAESMKNRGYGTRKRTAFSIFRFCKRDFFALAYIAVCAVIVIIGVAFGAVYFRFFPTLRFSGGGFLVYAAFFAQCALPVILNLKEDLTWKRIKSKI